MLRLALYAPYLEEVVVDSSTEYANKQWEETAEVTKYEIEEEAVVVCHKCWMDVKGRAINRLTVNVKMWKDDVGSNLMAIKSFIRHWDEHAFGDKTEDREAAEMVTALKLAIRRFARGK